MEIIGALSLLRRYWLLVVPGILLAMLAGTATLYQVSLSPPGLASRVASGGVAAGDSMLTTSAAPAFQISSKSHLADNLPSRAVMLANYMSADEIRDEIAQRAGIDPKELAVFGPVSGSPPIEVPIATEATAAALLPQEKYRVSVATQVSPPIITVRANAPRAAEAAKLVEAVRGTMDVVLRTQQGGEERISTISLGPVAVDADRQRAGQEARLDHHGGGARDLVLWRHRRRGFATALVRRTPNRCDVTPGSAAVALPGERPSLPDGHGPCLRRAPRRCRPDPSRVRCSSASRSARCRCRVTSSRRTRRPCLATRRSRTPRRWCRSRRCR